MRRRRALGWLVGFALPLVVCAGVLVMHGLDDPAGAHGAGAEATAGHDHDGSVVDLHCATCVDATHVVVVCLAVLVVAVRARWSGGVRRAAISRPRGPRMRVDAPAAGCWERPVWLRLAVMLR